MAFPKKHLQLIFLHTAHLTRRKVRRLLKRGQSFEIDVSIDKKGHPYFGHPKKWYAFHHKILHRNVSVKTAVRLLKRKPDVFVVLDIKDKRAVPEVEKIVNALGGNRCVIHAFASELVFDEHETYKEPHRFQENIPINELATFKTKYGCLIILSARGYTSRLENTVLERFNKVENIMDVFNNYGSSEPLSSACNEWLESHSVLILQDFTQQKLPSGGTYIGYIGRSNAHTLQS